MSPLEWVSGKRSATPPKLQDAHSYHIIYPKNVRERFHDSNRPNHILFYILPLFPIGRSGCMIDLQARTVSLDPKVA